MPFSDLVRHLAALGYRLIDETGATPSRKDLSRSFEEKDLYRGFVDEILDENEEEVERIVSVISQWVDSTLNGLG